MISAISEIGKYLLESGEVTKEDIIKNLVNSINGDTIKEIFLIDVCEDGINTSSEEFYSGISYKSLFYQAGRGVRGGGIRADFYKDEEKEKKKFLDKITSAVDYCEVTEAEEEVKKLILDKIEGGNKEFFAVILKEGKYPSEIFSEKFLNDFYTVDSKKIKGKHICHNCGKLDDGFNTVTFKFYTNDKEVYGNVDHKDKSGVIICKECLEQIILGKKHIEEYMTTYWMGSNVMFVPHSFNEEIDMTYQDTNLSNGQGKKLLDNIAQNESEVLKELGKGNGETDIVFFEKDGKKTFYIYHTIKSLLPSRFAFLSEAMKETDISLYWLVNKIASVKYGKSGLEPTEKERFKLLDAIFVGKKINRSEFFKRSLKHYKDSYYSKDKSYKSLKEYHKYYNFLVKCKCLEGGYDFMKEYRSYSELIEENKEYFSSNEKKAWFIIGVAYDFLNWTIKSKNRDEEGKIQDRTSLDKNFFFSRKFDFKDFIYFSNLIDEKMRKYRINSGYLKGMLSEAKELMASKEGKLSSDEAKYNFFWGMDAYFKKVEEEKNEEVKGEVING